MGGPSLGPGRPGSFFQGPLQRFPAPLDPQRRPSQSILGLAGLGFRGTGQGPSGPLEPLSLLRGSLFRGIPISPSLSPEHLLPFHPYPLGPEPFHRLACLARRLLYLSMAVLPPFLFPPGPA